MYKFTLQQLRSAAAWEKQVSWFVGNQKAVLGITEGSGRVDLDQKDEQRKVKRVDYMEEPSGFSPNYICDFPEKFGLTHFGVAAPQPFIDALWQNIPKTRKECYRWVPDEFDAKASEVYAQIGEPKHPLNFSANFWANWEVRNTDNCIWITNFDRPCFGTIVDYQYIFVCRKIPRAKDKREERYIENPGSLCKSSFVGHNSIIKRNPQMSDQEASTKLARALKRRGVCLCHSGARMQTSFTLSLFAAAHFLWKFDHSDPYAAASYDCLHFFDGGIWGRHMWVVIKEYLQMSGLASDFNHK
ncbi:hypothetical protein B0H14DRAFT_2585429 [Mycena olivaceomarginata]|nr:hypothetical protein B0H14DRAFT_2585429 [Mycena olivaceomarginata]